MYLHIINTGLKMV